MANKILGSDGGEKGEKPGNEIWQRGRRSAAESVPQRRRRRKYVIFFEGQRKGSGTFYPLEKQSHRRAQHGAKEEEINEKAKKQKRGGKKIALKSTAEKLREGKTRFFFKQNYTILYTTLYIALPCA